MLRSLPLVLGLLLLLGAWSAHTARPAESAAPSEGVDVVICLDVSRSMRARDVVPDRLGRAQQEIAALAERVRGDRVGLVLVAGEARLLVPRTADVRSLAELAARAGPWDVPRGGTDLGAALKLATASLEGRRGPGAIVLLTDSSEGTRASVPGVPVHVVGIGSTRGAKIPREDGRGYIRDRAGQDVLSVLDAGALEALAYATGGTYRPVGDDVGTLADLYTDVIVPDAERASAGPRGLDAVGWWLLAALALLLLDLALVGRGRHA